MLSPLTFKQARVRDFILSFQQDRGYSPSFKEIGEAFELRSLASVSRYIRTLKRKGAIRQRPRRSRSLRVVEMPGIRIACPICGEHFRLPIEVEKEHPAA